VSGAALCGLCGGYRPCPFMLREADGHRSRLCRRCFSFLDLHGFLKPLQKAGKG
jgi:hypothetical protein